MIQIKGKMMDLNPRYWYTDEEGKIQKKYYCKLCNAGPFKDIEEGINFKFYGLRNTDVYCTSCGKVHGFFQPPKIVSVMDS